MRQSVLTRASLFGIAILAAIIYLLPTFVSPLPAWWASFLPTDRINLGLDLQGGSHLVLDVKVDKAIENNVERVRGDLTNVLREKGVSGVSVERTEGTQLQIKVPAASAERVRGILKSDFAYLAEAKTPQTSGGRHGFLFDPQQGRAALAARLCRRSVAGNDSQPDRSIRRQRADHSTRRTRKYPDPASRHSRSRARQGDYRQDGSFGIQARRRHGQC